jgi:hypothetical protein
MVMAFPCCWRRQGSDSPAAAVVHDANVMVLYERIATMLLKMAETTN